MRFFHVKIFVFVSSYEANPHVFPFQGLHPTLSRDMAGSLSYTAWSTAMIGPQTGRRRALV